MHQRLFAIQINPLLCSISETLFLLKRRLHCLFDDVLEPGCHCLPWLRVQQLDDNVFVTVVTSIQYWAFVRQAANAFYKLSNTRAQIQSYVFDASVPKLIAKAVEEELERDFPAKSAYGFEIIQMVLVDIEPDEHVKRTMSEINAVARTKVHQTIEVGLRDSVLAFSMNVPGTMSKDVMDMVLATQCAVKVIASQIRDGLLQANTTQN
ncbi:hypothetical protein RGQ29_018352 [Quercus rubra]|uniref:Band 7 domain-containing protein n=1 Tax=Quercus rubra TaxID=3512 RepID=A0AAN7FNT7_QUERU|nr:hypothetical protein RGQ29_018352 [Quercus rubra]